MRDEGQLTIRAIAAGMVIGGCLSLCNIYSGLKIGFTTNMSIAAALLAFGGFRGLSRWPGTRPFGLGENVINQTAASAAASIAGAGLVAPIPALTLLTGHEFGWVALVVWTLGVSMLGVVVGLGVRRQLIEAQGLPFPHGMATAEVLRRMYERSADAVHRLYVLLGAMGFGAVAKASIELWRIPVAWVPGALPGAARASLRNLGWGIDPSVLMVGVGALIGLRGGVSMLVGAIAAWLVLGPVVLARGWVSVDGFGAGELWFVPVSGWMLWPGAGLMVGAALTSFAMSVPRMMGAGRVAPRGRSRALWWGVAVVGSISVVLQVVLFDIGPAAAVFAIALSFGLAVVAGRVTGETGIVPIGAMGKVTQLAFALVVPGNVTTNLMAANVTGGSASQCSDMLHDLKTGHLLGVSPTRQGIAQMFGVLSGALVGSAGYLALVPDPRHQLMTERWPAPAVAQWKAVAEVFTEGAGHLPSGALVAAIVGLVAGGALAIATRVVPDRWARYVPNAASIGLAFVLPAYYSVSVFVGAAIAEAVARLRPARARFVVIVGAGLIAGESLCGVGFALERLVSGR